MTSLDRWLTRLSFDDRSRRAITEAALDWQHEVATATTLPSRLMRHVQSSAGFVGLIAQLAVREIGQISTSGWGLLFFGWLATLTWWSFTPCTEVRWSADARHVDSLMNLLYACSNALPLAAGLTLASGRHRWTTPMLGLVSVIAMIQIVIGRILLPMTGRWLMTALAGTISVNWFQSGPGQDWWFIALAVATCVTTLLAGDYLRRDRSRLRVSAAVVAVAVVYFCMVYAFAIVDLGFRAHILSGDFAYLPLPSVVNALRMYDGFLVRIAAIVLVVWLAARRSAPDLRPCSTP